MVGERVELLNAIQLACPRSYAVVDISCFPLIVEVETIVSEVTTAQANGGRLSGCGRTRPEGTEMDDRVCDPRFARSSLLPVDRRRRGMDEDDVMRCQMDRPIDLRAAAREGDIVDLENAALAILNGRYRSMKTCPYFRDAGTLHSHLGSMKRSAVTALHKNSGSDD